MAIQGERHFRLSVAPELRAERLDRFLAAALPEFSRSRLKLLIEAGRVSAGGATIAEPSYRVKPGQLIELSVPPAETVGLPEAEAHALSIIYEDADVIVIDKPPGMAAHPAPGTPSGTLVNALIGHCGASLSGIGGVRRPGIVHRLDKDTSGLIVAAKHDRAHAGLARQFATRSLSRSYLALVWGTPAPSSGEITGNIGRSPKDRKKMAVLRTGGRPALTRYRVLRRFLGGRIALVECTLATGRTHQIRVHMAHKGYPLLGDPAYGRRRGTLALPPEFVAALAGFRRQALHAYRLGFSHPISGVALQFETPLPYDFKSLIDVLEDKSRA